MSQHTPEPWEVTNPIPFLAPVISTPTAGGIAVMRCREDGSIHTTVDLGTAQGNASRIVACVNGCADLNPTAYRECVEALKALLRYAIFVGTTEQCRTQAQQAIQHAEGKE